MNPFSKFDFGLLTGLPGARRWQAKGIAKKKIEPSQVRRDIDPARVRKYRRRTEMKLYEHPDFELAILCVPEHFGERGLRPAVIEKDC